jgi:hypothetical protein
VAAPICGGAIRGDRRSDIDPRRLELGAISKADYARHHYFYAAAPEITLRLLTYALVAGAIVLFPSLFFLFSVFKGFSKGNEKLMLSVLANGILNRFIDLAL